MKAQIVACQVYIDCPNCGEGVMNSRNGSYLWEWHWVAQGAEVFCSDCGQKLVIPKWLRQKVSSR